MVTLRKVSLQLADHHIGITHAGDGCSRRITDFDREQAIELGEAAQAELDAASATLEKKAVLTKDLPDPSKMESVPEEFHECNWYDEWYNVAEEDEGMPMTTIAVGAVSALVLLLIIILASVRLIRGGEDDWDDDDEDLDDDFEDALGMSIRRQIQLGNFLSSSLCPFLLYISFQCLV